MRLSPCFSTPGYQPSVATRLSIENHARTDGELPDTISDREQINDVYSGEHAIDFGNDFCWPEIKRIGESNDPQNGQFQPCLRALVHLEKVLELSPGDLFKTLASRTEKLT